VIVETATRAVSQAIETQKDTNAHQRAIARQISAVATTQIGFCGAAESSAEINRSQ
jgi:hypothetical protein